MRSEQAALERLQERLEELPGEGPGLGPDAAEEFSRKRRRIHRHHVTWRDGLPTMETLFDDASHRAKALAGNLGTELEDVLTSWARIRARAGAPDRAAERFIDRTAERWIERTGEFPGAAGWSEEPAEVFEEFLDDLAERARRRGREALRSGPERPTSRSRLKALFEAVLRGPVKAVRRFFRPVS